jgi:hypothetical protein
MVTLRLRKICIYGVFPVGESLVSFSKQTLQPVEIKYVNNYWSSSLKEISKHQHHGFGIYSYFHLIHVKEAEEFQFLKL